jgi:hypothetical protein
MLRSNDGGKALHFLSTEEFNRLTTEEKAAYMVKGIEELKKIIESLERQAKERGRDAR